MFARATPFPLHKEINAMHLRVVDIFEDPHVWACVDDGCNSGCHSEMWHENARHKWARKGVCSYLQDPRSTNFAGVGNAPSAGKFVIPVGFMLEESQLRLPGSVESHEMKHGTHPLLISQSVQAKLGMRKDMREGSITFKDYDDQRVEVCRQKGTGLFIIRIDHFSIDDYLNPRSGGTEVFRGFVFPHLRKEYDAKLEAAH